MERKYFLVVLDGKTALLRDDLSAVVDGIMPSIPVVARMVQTFGEDANAGDMFSALKEGRNLIIVRLADREYELTEVCWS